MEEVETKVKEAPVPSTSTNSCFFCGLYSSEGNPDGDGGRDVLSPLPPSLADGVCQLFHLQELQVKSCPKRHRSRQQQKYPTEVLAQEVACGRCIAVLHSIHSMMEEVDRLLREINDSALLVKGWMRDSQQIKQDPERNYHRQALQRSIIAASAEYFGIAVRQEGPTESSEVIPEAEADHRQAEGGEEFHIYGADDVDDVDVQAILSGIANSTPLSVTLDPDTVGSLISNQPKVSLRRMPFLESILKQVSTSNKTHDHSSKSKRSTSSHPRSKSGAKSGASKTNHLQLSVSPSRIKQEPIESHHMELEDVEPMELDGDDDWGWDTDFGGRHNLKQFDSGEEPKANKPRKGTKTAKRFSRKRRTRTRVKFSDDSDDDDNEDLEEDDQDREDHEDPEFPEDSIVSSEEWAPYGPIHIRPPPAPGADGLFGTTFPTLQPKGSRGHKFCCRACGKPFNTREYARKHVLYHLPWTNLPHKCRRGDCTAAYHTAKSLRRHITEFHLTGRSLTEVYTRHTPADKPPLTEEEIEIRRLAKLNKSTEFACEVCSAVYKNKNKYLCHVETHKPHGERRLNCDQCTFGCYARYQLNKHVRRVHDPIFKKEYRERAKKMCPQCGIIVSDLSHHRAVHLGEGDPDGGEGHKHFKCEVCGKGFKRKEQLVIHLRVHTGVRPYACDHPGCEASFKTSNGLKRHTFIHSEERQFVCEACGKAFRFKSSLTEHIHIHGSDKPYRCNSCGKRCATKDLLEQHIDVDHNPEVEQKKRKRDSTYREWMKKEGGGGGETGRKSEKDYEPPQHIC